MNGETTRRKRSASDIVVTERSTVIGTRNEQGWVILNEAGQREFLGLSISEALPPPRTPTVNEGCCEASRAALGQTDDESNK